MSSRASRIDLVLRDAIPDLVELMRTARTAGGVDRSSPRGADPSRAQEVLWGGRMQRALVQVIDAPERGAPSLDAAAQGMPLARVRVEADLSGDGFVDGLARHANLVLVLADALGSAVIEIDDRSARTRRDRAWLERVATGSAHAEDATSSVEHVDAAGIAWLATHGAARFAIPDLELYGLSSAALPAGRHALARVHAQLLDDGLAARLSLVDGTVVRLVPVLEVWGSMPLGWPGVGRAGVDRGEGLDGPRATLSVLHRARFGRHRLDLDGVRARLAAQG
jgi:hypothetical protein